MDAVIIMDRSVDILTPFVTQMTYQGIIDESMGIEINRIVIDKQIPLPKEDDRPKDGNQTMNLYLTDPIFEAIKDLRIGDAGKLLREKLTEYQELINSRDGNSTDLKFQLQLSNEIKKKRFVEPHVNIASHLRQNIQNRLLTIEQVILIESRNVFTTRHTKTSRQRSPTSYLKKKMCILYSGCCVSTLSWKEDSRLSTTKP